MKEEQLNDYLKKLQEIDKEISDNNSTDMEFTNELEKLFAILNKDITNKFSSENKSHMTNMLDVKIKKLRDDAVIPTYSNDGDAGMDLVATQVLENITHQVSYGTGIAMEIPYGYVGLVFPRSSIRKYELELSNSVGVIDSVYRGEIRVIFNKTNGFDSAKYKVGDRIAQIIILPYPKINFVLSDELSETKRGEGGFGSTGL